MNHVEYNETHPEPYYSGWWFSKENHKKQSHMRRFEEFRKTVNENHIGIKQYRMMMDGLDARLQIITNENLVKRLPKF